MKRLLISILSDRVFQIKNLSEKIVKLKMAAVYVKIVKVFRKIMVSIFVILFCLMLFISGITIIHITILFFAPWTEMTRIILTLVFGCIYIFLGAGLFIFLVSQKNWVELFQIDGLINYLTKEGRDEKKGE